MPKPAGRSMSARRQCVAGLTSFGRSGGGVAPESKALTADIRDLNGA